MTDHSSRSDPSAGPSTALIAGLGCLVLAAFAVGIDAILKPANASLTREGGALELASAGFYFVAIATLVVRSGRPGLWQSAVILAAMGLRELDADKRFTSEGILSTKIFVYDTPLWEKIVAAAVLGLLIFAIVTLLAKSWTALRAGLRSGERWTLYLAGAAVLTVVSKSIDGLARKLAPYDISISEGTSATTGRIEEVLELGIPILLIMAILETARRSRPSRSAG